MTVLDTLAKQAGRLATDVQASLKRARLEGERRLLQRQHRAALEDLGERAYELVRAGGLPEEPLAPELAEVESKLMEIEAKMAEIETLRVEGEGEDEERPDASHAAFPMVGDEDSTPPAGGGRGTGWEAAERFFKRD